MRTPWPCPCTRTDRFQTGRFLFGPDPPCPETTSLFFPPDMACLLTHQEHRFSASTEGPLVSAHTDHSPKTAAPQHSYSCYNHTVQPQPFLRGRLPRGVHSTVVAVPSSPMTVRHAPPDVGSFFTTSLLPKDLACVVVSRQPPEGRHHSPGPTQLSFRLDPIRIGNHQRRGMLRFDAEPPAESARRQGIRPCTAQNLRLPPTTVETKIRPAGLLARLRTNELSTAHGIPCPGFRPGSLANRGLPVPCREINLLQPPTADIECCDPFR